MIRDLDLMFKKDMSCCVRLHVFTREVAKVQNSALPLKAAVFVGWFVSRTKQ